MDDWQKGGFGLYIHWPFCTSKCPYCDFNSHVSKAIDHEEWQQAYLTAIDFYAAQTPDQKLDSIYFGGGTPSLMKPDLVQAIIDRAQARWHFGNDIEITLEANPGSVESARFHDFHHAGVNRVSLGIQALSDTDLRKLGRMHSVRDALSALEIAQDVFDRTSFDLIYGRQGQSLSDWEKELETALSFAPNHLSLYQLTIEPGTVFGAREIAGKLKGLPDEDLAIDMFDMTNNLCVINGLPAYEVSNHAKSGAESKHNLIYWNAGDYVGIGPGAHGRLSLSKGRYATETPLAPSDWLQNVKANGSGESERLRLSAQDQATEYLIMGLRTKTGISLPRYKAMGGKDFDLTKIADLSELGLIKEKDWYLKATGQGVPLLNAIIQELAPL